MTQQAPPPAGMPDPRPGDPPLSPPYGMPQGQLPGYGMPPVAPPRTSGLAIGALVAAFVFAPLGIILGIVARKQIRRTGEGGRGLATAAVWLGAIFTAIGIVAVVLVVVAVANAVPTVPASGVSSAIEEQASLPAGSVSCPGELSGTIGNTMTCTATTANGPTNVVATVTSVDGTTVRFDFREQ